MALAFLAILIVQINFGILPVAQKVALTALTPLGLFSIRNIFGALLFYGAYLVLPKKQVSSPIPRRVYLWLGLLGITLNQFLLILALTKTSAVALVVVVPAITLFTYGFAVLLKREIFAWKKGLTLLLGGAGVVILFLDGFKHMLDHMDSSLMLGNIFSISSAACYAYYLVIARDYVTRQSAIEYTSKTFAWALCWLVPLIGFLKVSAAGHDWRTLFVIASDSPVMTPKLLAVLGFIVVGPTFLNYFLNIWALSRLPSSTVSGFISLQTLIGASLAHYYLGEEVKPGYVIAGVCIVGSVVLLSLTSIRRRKSDSQV